MKQYHIKDVQTGEFYSRTKDGKPIFTNYRRAKPFSRLGEAQSYIESARINPETGSIRSITIIEK
jgi:hypothetical protein